jgi:hypothetical protein
LIRFLLQTFFDELVDWNGGVLDSYGISGKAKDPGGLPRRLKNLAPWKASIL